MAFVRSPDKHSIELLQKGAAAAAGTVEIDAEYRQMVGRTRLPLAAKLFIPPEAYSRSGQPYIARWSARVAPFV